MTLWWQALLLCASLSCIQCVPAPVLHNEYLTSYRLARFTRCRVQQLLVKYKKEQLGSQEYEDRSQRLKGLPSLSTEFYSWLNLTDRERLGAALSDMQAFRSMLEWKREEISATDAHSTVTKNFHHIECDLRDLVLRVNSQMNYTGGTSMRPPSPRASRVNARSSTTQWDSRVEGYIILRDLDLYLIKLARDFLLLATKTAAPRD